MANKKSIVFLHLPKTAGQSVHTFLERLVGPGLVSPTRVAADLIAMPLSDLDRYHLFSGHLDWNRLDAVRHPKFVFTILRDPLERILSFYFYMRQKGIQLSAADLELPQFGGEKAALTLSCDDYFCFGPEPLRNFIDDHFYNLYTYYFATRRFEGRQEVTSRETFDGRFSRANLLALALANMQTLDGIYRIDELARLERDVVAFYGVDGGRPEPPVPSLREIRENIGDDKTVEDRLDALRQLGATDRTFARINEMTELDRVIWQHYNA